MNRAIIRPTRIYIIRLWAEPDQASLVWRASIQPVHQREIQPLGFASLAEAAAFLETEIANVDPLEFRVQS